MGVTLKSVIKCALFVFLFLIIAISLFFVTGAGYSQTLFPNGPEERSSTTITLTPGEAAAAANITLQLHSQAGNSASVPGNEALHHSGSVLANVTLDKRGRRNHSLDESANVSMSNFTGNHNGFMDVETAGLWHNVAFRGTDPAGNILLVDDDAGSSYETYYTTALDALGRSYDYWNDAESGPPSSSLLSDYSIVIWETGDDWDGETTISSDELAALASYLDGGGSLFISGQWLGWASTQEVGGNPEFYANYLRASYITEEYANYDILGYAGDPVADGWDLVLTGGDGAGNNNGPDIIEPVNDAVAIATHIDTSWVSAIRYSGTYRLVYLSFPFESIDNEADRDEVMNDIISWLIPPPITVQSPLNQTYNTDNIWASVTSYEEGSCNASLDEGANFTLSNSTGRYHNYLMTVSEERLHNVTFWCEDGVGNLNYLTVYFTSGPKILLVDDDAGSSYETYYTTALDALGRSYDYWNDAESGPPSSSLLSNYDNVIWETGDEWDQYEPTTISSDEQAALASYLDGGGSLFISGQYLGWALTQAGSGPEFYANYLRASYITEEYANYDILGYAGDPVADGWDLVLTGGDGAGNNNGPDIIEPVNDAVAIATHTDTSWVSAIRYSGTYRLVYLSFPFESIDNEADRDEVMNDIISWLTFPIVVRSPLNQRYNTDRIWADIILNNDGYCNRSLDGGENVSMSNTSRNFYDLMTVSEEGLHNVTFFCNDTFGNASSIVSYFSVDFTPPTITIQSPLNQTYDISDLWANVTLDEPGSCDKSLDSGSNISLSNTSGNFNVLLGHVQYLQQDFDEQASGGAPTGWYNVPSGTGSNKVSSSQYVSYPNSMKQDCASELRIDARNFPNALSLSEDFVVEFDWFSTSKSVGFILFDDYTSGGYSPNYATSLDFILTGRKHGTYTLFLENYGNIISPVSLNTWHHLKLVFKWDTKTLDAYVDDELVAQDAAFVGNPDAIRRIYSEIDEIGTWYYDDLEVYPTNNPLENDGPHNVTFYCNDTAGHQNSTIQYFTIGIPPVITIQSPLNPNYSGSVWANVTLNEAGSCDLSVNDTNNVSMSNTSGNFNYYLTSLPDGPYNVTFFCNDTNGNLNSSTTQYFSVDAIPPTLTIQSPLNTTYDTASVWANVTLSEDGACSASLDEGEFFSLSNSSGNFNSLMSIVNPYGLHSLQFFCVDGVGNLNSTTVYFNENIHFPMSYDASSSANVMVNGTMVNDVFGVSVAHGEVNGDGYDDLIIGAYGASSGAGRAYVFFGGPTANLNGKNWDASYANVTINGTNAGDSLGISVTSGDVNDDSYDDLIIAAYGASPNGQTNAGQIYVFFGGPNLDGKNWDAASSANITINGTNAGDLLGAYVGSGDFNGDNYDDLSMGGWAPDPNGVTAAGQVYVFFGGPNLDGKNWDAASANVTINGTNAYDYLGSSVSSGDVNGDNYDDLITGALYADPNGQSDAGQAYVFFGGPTEYLDGKSWDAASANVTVSGTAAGDRLGYSVSSGDVNSDGYSDLIIGAYGAGSFAGQVYVFFGSPTEYLDSKSWSAVDANVTIDGANANDYLGYSVYSGDVNGDNYDDLIVGAFGAADYAGQAYVFFGGPTEYLDGKSWDASSANVTVSGTNEFDQLGISVASGDVDGDGYDDLIIGAIASPNGQHYAGQAYVFFIMADTIPPVMSFTPPTPANNLITDTVIAVINVSVSENVTSCNLTWHGVYANVTNSYSMNVLNMDAGTTANYTIECIQDDMYSYSVSCADLVGNADTSTARNLTIDTTPPDVTLVSPSNDTLSGNPNQNLTANVSDAGSLKNATVYVYDQNGTLYFEGTTEFAQEAVTQGNLGTMVTLDNGVYEWFYTVFDWTGRSATTAATNRSITVDLPYIRNFRLDPINSTEIKANWDNSRAGQWTSMYIYNLDEQAVESKLLTVQLVTGDSATFSKLQPNTKYLMRWQQGVYGFEGNFSTMYFRTAGWMPILTDWTQRRLITINSSKIQNDDADTVLNLTLTDETFTYSLCPDWWCSHYVDFASLNYTNGNDIRFTDYYSTEFLDYDVTQWNILGNGGAVQQTIPNGTEYEGSYDNTTYCHDGDWNSRCIPLHLGLKGTQWYNYTIPLGAKTSSLLRLYVGTWFWDRAIPADCFAGGAGSNLEFETMQDYITPSAITYCRNQSAGNGSWILVYDNGNVSSYFYESLITWVFDSNAELLVRVKHFDDATQKNAPGVDGNYNVKLWMYYGNPAAESNKTTVSYGSAINSGTLNSRETYSVSTPTISDLNDGVERTPTSTTITWIVDQRTDNRVRLATNPWLIESWIPARHINVTESFFDINGNVESVEYLVSHHDDFMNVVNVSCSNPDYSLDYSINTSSNPVSIVFHNVWNNSFFEWTITYETNKTWDMQTVYPEIKLEDLATDTTYYYEIISEGLGGNATGHGSFTLGTPRTTPASRILNYSEYRHDRIVSVCGELTDLGVDDSVNVSIQYWDVNESTVFNETESTVLADLGVVCHNISVDYGHTYGYRVKAVGATDTIFSDAYFHDVMAVQDFFVGDYLRGDSDNLHRQYCPNGVGTIPCYEQTGVREGSYQDTDWVWIESGINNSGSLTVNWWDGNSWSAYPMTRASDSNMSYLMLENLPAAWQTLYISNDTGSVILNWTKPSLNRPLHGLRTEESKYVYFNKPKEAVNYTLLYLDYVPYDVGSYDYCLANGGDIFSCMSVETFGDSQAAVNEQMGGSPYDRGQLFAGGSINGKNRDTGHLISDGPVQYDFTSNDYGVGSGIANNTGRFCFSFTDYYWEANFSPSNNITSYYYRHWGQNQWFSDYYGYIQNTGFDMFCIRTYDDVTGRWGDYGAPGCVSGTAMSSRISAPNASQVNGSVFDSPFNQSLFVGFKDGFVFDTGNDNIYNMLLNFDGQWINQMFNRHQQAFVIFNLPSNETLQGLDSDGDGINDFDELFVHYTNPFSNDTDGGGVPDGLELATGTNPNIYTDDDLTPPVIAVLSPGNITLSFIDVWANVTLDKRGRCNYSLDGSANVSMSNSTGNHNSLMDVAGDGLHNVTFFCNDAIGNMNSTVSYFSVDLAPPTITIQSPLNQTYTTASVWTNVTLNESGSCNASIDDGANFTLSNSSGNFNSFMSIVNPYGSHSLQFFCTDIAGNLNRTIVYFNDSSHFPMSFSAASSTNLTVNGTAANNYLGDSVASGDVNGDGYSDLIIGASGAVSSAGKVYVFFGGPTASLDGKSWTSASANVTINGTTAGDYLGDSVASGDVNGDGYSDLIIGADGASLNNQSRVGQAYVFFGGPTASLDGKSRNSTSANVTINGTNADDYLGQSVSSGDVNGDGYKDAIIGAYNASPNSQSSAGKVYVFFGGPTASLDGKSWTSSSANVTINGTTAGDYLGDSVASGDVNGDGYSDLITGASGASPNGQPGAGQAYVFFGNMTASLDGKSRNSTSANVTINGTTAGDDLGWSVSSGDVNGDGYSDLIIGADYADPYVGGVKKTNAGHMYVFFVMADTTPPVITVQSPLNQTYDGNVWANVTINESGRCKYSLDESINVSMDNSTGNHNHLMGVASNGLHNVTFFCNDTTGNMNSTVSYFSVDLTPPTITVQSPLNQTYNTASIWVNVTIDEDGNCNRSFDGGTNASMTTSSGVFNNFTSGLSEGRHNVTVWCKDRVGNRNSTTQYLGVDVSPPTISILSPRNVSYDETNIFLEYFVSDNFVGINATWFEYNGMNTSLSGNTSFVAVPNTVSTLILWSNDSVGNPNHDSVTFTNDIVEPFVTIISPPDGSNYSTNNLTLEYFISDNFIGIRSVWYLYNSVNVSLSGNTTFLALDSQYSTLTLFANDSVGNINSTTTTFYTDDTPPFVALLSPKNLTYVAYDSWVIPIEYFINETPGWIGYSLDNGSNVTLTVNTTLNVHSNGQHSIALFAKDVYFNNCNASGPVYFFMNVSYCGDLVCNETYGEDRLTCPVDCGRKLVQPEGTASDTREGFVIGNVSAGVTLNLTAQDPELHGVTGISIILSDNASGVVVRFENASTDSDSTFAVKSGESVYSYIKFTIEGFTDDEVVNASVRFRVDRSWFETEGLDVSSLRLYRHASGAWSELETGLVGEDDTYYYFESQTPGFSVFAITAMKLNASASVNPPVVSSPNVTPQIAGFCGDKKCSINESCSSCPSDCGACPPSGVKWRCGDLVCNTNESCVSCPSDCGSCGVVIPVTAGAVFGNAGFLIAATLLTLLAGWIVVFYMRGGGGRSSKRKGGG